MWTHDCHLSAVLSLRLNFLFGSFVFTFDFFRRMIIALLLVLGCAWAFPSGRIVVNVGAQSTAIATVDLASGAMTTLLDTSGNFLFHQCPNLLVNAFDSKRNIWWSVQCTNSSENVPSFVGVNLASTAITQLHISPQMTENDFITLWYSSKMDALIAVYQPEYDYVAIRIDIETGKWSNLFNFSADTDLLFAWADKSSSIYSGLSTSNDGIGQWTLLQSSLNGKLLSSVNITDPSYTPDYLVGEASSGRFMTAQSPGGSFGSGAFQMESYAMPSATPDLSATVFQWGGSSGEGSYHYPTALVDPNSSQQGFMVLKGDPSATFYDLCWISLDASTGKWNDAFSCANQQIPAINSIIYIPA